jgi:hypothetical protein|tara:strand:+ start:1434 stop:1838 length:405 start_codon:yes stop_codon:yes gene_type:complete
MLRPPLVKQIKFANKEVEVFLQFVKTKLGQEISMFPIELDDFEVPWGKNFDGITIMANEDFNEFEVGYEVYEGGSYWEPSTTDYAEHSKHKTLELALLAMLSLWVGMSYRNFQESQWAEESVAELDVELDWSLD